MKQQQNEVVQAFIVVQQKPVKPRPNICCLIFLAECERHASWPYVIRANLSL